MRTVITCNNLAETSMVRSLLEADGIQVLIPQEYTPGPVAGFPGGFQVQVPEESAVRAMEILQSAELITAGAPSSAPSPEVPQTSITWFRWLVAVDALLAIGIWLNAQRVDESRPLEVRNYLESLAASDALWGLGFNIFMVGFVLNLAGSLSMLFRWQTGLWLYASGMAVQILWLWVFPGGISHGFAAVIGSTELVLAGFILGWAFTDRRLLGKDS